MSLLWETIHPLKGKVGVDGSALLARHGNEEINGLGGWSTCPALSWVSCDLCEVSPHLHLPSIPYTCQL